jgi:hypothetical protein
MNVPELLQKKLLAIGLVLSCQAALGQVMIDGTVYDRSQLRAMQGVSVIGTSGKGTVTDSLGHYTIRLPEGDSIYFSYLGKSTSKFPVKEVVLALPFDMSLQVGIDSLPPVLVRSPNYELDSLANRQEYQKVFDYGANYIDNMKSTNRGRGMGVGVDFDMLFAGKKIRRMEAFQKRLVEEEQDKYVDHRFTRALVRRITGLQPPALDTFMRQYRPSYEFVQSCQTDYEFYKYILDWGKFFAEDWKKDHPEGTVEKTTDE